MMDIHSDKVTGWWKLEFRKLRIFWNKNSRDAPCNYEKNAGPFNSGCYEKDETSEAGIADFCMYTNASVVPLHMKPSDYETPRELPPKAVTEHKGDEDTGSSTHGSLKSRTYVSDLSHSKIHGDFYKPHPPDGHEHMLSCNRVAVLACSLLTASGAAFYESTRLSDGRHNPSNPYADGLITHDPVLLAALRRLGPDVLAVTIFTAATRTIYGLKKQHKYQGHFVLGGIIVGTFVGMAAYRDLQNTVLKAVSWAILVALLVDTVVNRIVG